MRPTTVNIKPLPEKQNQICKFLCIDSDTECTEKKLVAYVLCINCIKLIKSLRNFMQMYTIFNVTNVVVSSPSQKVTNS